MPPISSRIRFFSLLSAWRPPSPSVVCRCFDWPVANSPTPRPGGQAVRILLIVDFGIGLGAVAELMADDHAPNPALRQRLIAEVIADLAIHANWPKAGIRFKRQQKIRAGGDYPAPHAACGVIERELRIGADAEVDHRLFGASSTARSSC